MFSAKYFSKISSSKESSILHTLRMSYNANQCKLQSCSHHMPVIFVKSVHGHVTQIWASVNTGGRGQRKVSCHVLCYLEMPSFKE